MASVNISNLYELYNKFYHNDKESLKNLLKSENLSNLLPFLDDIEHDDDITESDITSINDSSISIDDVDDLQSNDFKWRPNQLKGLNKNKENNFETGIHVQIMGAGKSNMILRTIQDKLEYDKEQNNHKNIYIIITERTEIFKKWLFDNDGNIDKIKTKDWKDKNIINFDDFDVIEKLFNKKSDWIDLLNDSTKPILFITNSAFFRINKKYEKLDPKISLLCYDECHGISGDENYKAVKFIKESGASIIGFSATPLRNTKKSEKYLFDIFSKNDKLNVLSFYHLIHALQDDVIIPFRFVLVNAYIKKNNGKNKVIVDDEAMKYIITRELEDIPYKKGIAWSKNIDKISPGGSQYKFFKNNFPELDLYYTHSKEKTDDIDKFYEKDNNSIILCVQRCREGSDIKNCDFAIYIDGVKKRAQHVTLQSSGRIIRPDKDKLKKYGLIIENIVIDDDKPVELQTVEKLMSYYDNILNISDIQNDVIDILEQYKELIKKTEINIEKQEIRIKVDNNINHDCIIKLELKEINWDLLKKFLQEKQNQKCNINRYDELKNIIEKVKKYVKLDIDTRYWEVYNDIPNKTEKGLPEDLLEEYEDIWKNHTWYHFLKYDVDWYTYIECKKQIKRYVDDIDNFKYQEILKKNNKFPPYPEELYRINDFNKYNDFFN